MSLLASEISTSVDACGPLRDPVNYFGEILCNKSGECGMSERFDALFKLKEIGGPNAIRCISEAFDDPSALLKHELAYVLGQMRDSRALPFLKSVLSNLDEHPMVRHEAGEAIGALGMPESIKDLEPYLDDKEEAVRDTCRLAIDRIKYENEISSKTRGAYRVEGDSPYCSIDPAPPEASYRDLSAEDIGKRLMDNSLPLFERYRAMFSLRNLDSKEAVLALSKGFADPNSLFKHEIAYVFGQMQNTESVPILKEVLLNQNEDPMVRHECAEALGSICSEEALDVLKSCLSDPSEIVRESCVVGLGISKSNPI